jgi:hypothetical protein
MKCLDGSKEGRKVALFMSYAPSRNFILRCVLRYLDVRKPSLYGMYAGVEHVYRGQSPYRTKISDDHFPVAGSMPLNTSLSRLTICCGTMFAIFPLVHRWETPL